MSDVTTEIIKEREMDIETKAKVVADYVSSDWTMEMVRDELAWLYKTLILDHDNADVSDFMKMTETLTSFGDRYVRAERDSLLELLYFSSAVARRLDNLHGIN